MFTSFDELISRKLVVPGVRLLGVFEHFASGVFVGFILRFGEVNCDEFNE
jgi:hypothetical protein